MLFFLTCALLLLALPAFADEARLTLMVYMTGSNLEAEYFSATNDIQEMIASRYDQDQVNVLIMTGGSETWWTPGISAENVSIYRLERANLVAERVYPLQSMAEPELLTTLLEYGCFQYPAQEHALILWDHGCGPVDGVCMDALFSDDLIQPAELSTALAESPFGPENTLAWIGFDACLMANAETARMLAPYAEYMIASQETEPGSGWDYGFLKGIEADASGFDTGKRIADLYYEAGMARTPGNNITLSVIDLSKMDTVTEASDGLFSALDSILTAESFSELAIRRQSARGVGRTADSESDYDLVDLLSLAQHCAAFAPKEAQALADALSAAVPYSRCNIDGLNGLSVYHPYYNKSAYTSKWRAEYHPLALSESYLRYLDTYSSFWLGEEFTSWKGLDPTCSVAPDGKSQTVSLGLTPAQAQDFASAELLVFSSRESIGCGFIYRETLDPPDAVGRLSVTYDGQQLVQIDAEGNSIASSLSYQITDGKIALPGHLTRYGTDGITDRKAMVAYYRPSGEDGALEYLYMDELMDNGHLNSRHNVCLSDWESFDVLYDTRIPTWDEGGKLLPFEQWQSDHAMLWRPLDLRQGLELRFSHEQVLSSDYAAVLQIRDTQGNIHVTPLIELDNLQAIDLAAAEQVLLDNDHCTVTLSGAQIVASALDPAIRLQVSILNKTAECLEIDMDYMLVNQTVTPAYPIIELPFDGIPADEIYSTDIEIPIEGLEQAQALQVDRLILYGETSLAGDYDSVLNFATAPVSLDHDFSDFLSLPEKTEPLAVCQCADFSLELLSLDVDRYNALSAIVRLTNDTDRQMELYLSDSRINDLKPQSQQGGTLLPAHASALETISFSNSGYLGTYPYFSEDMLGDMQIADISSLTLVWNVMHADGSETIQCPMELSKPWPYQAHRNSPAAGPMDTIALYEGEEFSVRLAGLAVGSGSVNVGVLLENRTDNDLTLTWESGGVNGSSEPLSFMSSTLYAETVSLTYACIYTDETAVSLPEDLQSVQMQYIVHDAQGTVLFRDLFEISLAREPGGDALFFPEDLQLSVLSHEAEPYTQIISETLIVPEDAERYRVLLSAPAAEDAASVSAHLITQQDGYFRPFILNMPMQPQSDGSWSCVYSGLYIGKAEDSSIYWPTAGIETENGKEIRQMGLLFSESWSAIEQGFYCSDAEITLDPVAGTASVAYASAPQKTAFPSRFADLSARVSAIIPAKDAAGRMLGFDELQTDYGAASAIAIAPMDLPARFALFPAVEFRETLYLVYSYTMADGSSFSTEPAPYLAAIQPFR